MLSILRVNDWLNSRAPGVKRIVRTLVPNGVRISFAERKFAATIASDDYSTVFRNIYLKNWWGSEESISGCGSELDRTASVRDGLTNWFKGQGITSVFDAPCGDYKWMKEVVARTGITYIGGDIVPELIASNVAENKDASKFLVFDILKSPLPSAQAWICRDVLFHLPNAEVQRVLERFTSSDIRFLLTTHFENVTVHDDIPFGRYRPVNLCQAPFNWPRPSGLIFDGDRKDKDRFLGIWENPRFA
jgi:hypothetical protein